MLPAYCTTPYVFLLIIEWSDRVWWYSTVFCYFCSHWNPSFTNFLPLYCGHNLTLRWFSELMKKLYCWLTCFCFLNPIFKLLPLTLLTQRVTCSYFWIFTALLGRFSTFRVSSLDTVYSLHHCCFIIVKVNGYYLTNKTH